MKYALLIALPKYTISKSQEAMLYHVRVHYWISSDLMHVIEHPGIRKFDVSKLSGNMNIPAMNERRSYMSYFKSAVMLSIGQSYKKFDVNELPIG